MSDEQRKVALVSGASRGIGAEIARQLAEDHGFLVLAGGRNPADVAAGGNVVAVELDVADQASVDALRQRIESDPGRLDVLVNNAGIHGGHYGDRFDDSDIDEIKRVMETNTFGAWRLTKALLPLLRSSDDPRVVNVSSGAGQLSDMDGGIHPYRLSKTGMNVLTRTLAADEDVVVNSVCPGWVATDMGGSNAPRTPAEGADTPVWLATDPGVGSGGFYRDRKPIPW